MIFKYNWLIGFRQKSTDKSANDMAEEHTSPATRISHIVIGSEKFKAENGFISSKEIHGS